MKTLEEIQSDIKQSVDWIHDCLVKDGTLIVEESYYMSENEKNDDDCCDNARENGEYFIDKYPQLKMTNYYCHRHKYSIVEFKLKKSF